MSVSTPSATSDGAVTENAPVVAAVVTAAVAEPPVGVAVMLTLAIPPPRLLVTVPAMEPVGIVQATVKFTVDAAPVFTVTLWPAGATQ